MMAPGKAPASLQFPGARAIPSTCERAESGQKLREILGSMHIYECWNVVERNVVHALAVGVAFPSITDLGSRAKTAACTRSLRGGHLSGSTVIDLARLLHLRDVRFSPTADALD